MAGLGDQAAAPILLIDIPRDMAVEIAIGAEGEAEGPVYIDAETGILPIMKRRRAIILTLSGRGQHWRINRHSFDIQRRGLISSDQTSQPAPI